jgi:hypothetical protein
MKRERDRYHLSPFRLHTVSRLSLIDCERNSSNISSSDREPKLSESKAQRVPAPRTGFADRYVSEVAPPKLLQTYVGFAEQHKQLLERENKELRDRFSEELLEAEEVEKSVQSIAMLMSEFSRMISTQSSDVDFVHQSAKSTADFVKETEAQLDLTIDRSKSSQRNMIIVTVGLAVLLLILDYLTP